MKKVLATDVPNSVGFKRLIEKFDDMIFDKLEALFSKKSEETLFEYSKVINDYIMKKLTSLLWHFNRQINPTDFIYRSQVREYDWIEARHMELPEAEKTENFAMWKVTTNLLR